MIRPIHEYGEIVPRPATSGYVELVSIDLPPGKSVLVSLHQVIDYVHGVELPIAELLAAFFGAEIDPEIFDPIAEAFPVTPLPAPGFGPVIPGLRWRAQLRDRSGTNRQPVQLKRAGHAGEIPWTMPDGRAIAQGLHVKGQSPAEVLSWGVQVDVDALPASITGFAGAILGFEVSDSFLENEHVYARFLRAP